MSDHDELNKECDRYLDAIEKGHQFDPPEKPGRIVVLRAPIIVQYPYPLNVAQLEQEQRR